MSPDDVFSPFDLQQLQTRGMTVEPLLQQLSWFRKGFPFICLQRPCTVGDGIVTLTPQEVDQCIVLHNQASAVGRTAKFVPASGAASRMFQSLLTLANRVDPLTPTSLASAATSGDRDCQQFEQFLTQLQQFAFVQ